MADFNADGRPDLVVVPGPFEAVSVLLGNGDGTFQAAVNFDVGHYPASVAVGDFNTDGRLDVVTGNYGSPDPNGSVSVLLNTSACAPCPPDLNGDRVVSLSDLTILLAHFGTPSGATLADGDLDADGAVDLGDLTILLANFGAACS